MTHWKTAAVTTVALAIVLALPLETLARGGGGRAFGGRGFGRPAGQSGSFRRVRPARSKGLLGRLVFPCAADCHEAARDCVADADAVALDCVAAACSAEVGEAVAACESRGETCRTALAALRDCGAECLDARATDVEGCRSDFEACADTCASEDEEDTEEGDE